MNKENLIDTLKVVLANSYALYLKTQNYHWNVEGDNFLSLHKLFEEQYHDLAAAIDEIAELIRCLGVKAPGRWSLYGPLISIQDGDENASPKDMVNELKNDQILIQEILKKALYIAQEFGDEITADILIARMGVHRKNHWILSSMDIKKIGE